MPTNSLTLLPLRNGVHNCSPLLSGLCDCFHQQNIAEVILCHFLVSSLRKVSVIFYFLLLKHCVLEALSNDVKKSNLSLLRSEEARERERKKEGVSKKEVREGRRERLREGRRPSILVSTAITKYHSLSALNNRSLFLTILEAGKFNINIPASLSL